VWQPASWETKRSMAARTGRGMAVADV
jgi:hypothetical protein